MLGDPAERFRLVAESMSEVFWIATPDLSKCLYINPAFERVWGRPVEYAYANSRAFLEAIHPDDRERCAQNLAARSATGVAFDHEYRIVRPDGEIRWIWGRGGPLRDASGEIAVYTGIAQDITARKRAESELATMAERFTIISHATNDAMWDWDMRTNASWWSEAYYSVFGYDRSTKPCYESWAGAIHPDDRTRVVTSFERAIARKETFWSEDYRILRMNDGKQLDVIDRAYVVHDEAGTPMRVVGVLMDITQRRALENQLRHAQKMEAVGQLAGGIAHDFNNILQAVTLELSLAANTAGVPPKIAQHIAESRGALERAASLTRQLLVFSRREAMRPRRIDLNAKLADLTRMVRRMIGEDVALQLDLAPGAIPIDADPAMIDQVLVNLALNARDAMPRGGTLAISTSIDDGTHRACIVVRDTGEGIPAEHLPRIFEPFFTTKDATRGTGLGLATVHGIIEQHRGSIDVSSEPGRGASFRIYLPLSDALNAPSPRDLPTFPRGTETILLVEDDDLVRRALKATLETAGYHVVDAARGATALSQIAGGARIDLLLTDMVMPDGMSGRDLAGRIATQAPNVRVVFMTGYSREDLDLLANETILRKPIDRENLLNALRTSLDR
jgi:PAS domain S-box-containing protein